MSATPGHRPGAPTLSPAKEALLAKLIRGAGAPHGGDAGGIPRGSEADWSPLSFAQLRLWFLERLTPGGATYNIPLVLRLRGPLDEGALQSALQALLDRHSILRCAIEARGDEPMQRPVPGVRLLLECEALALGDTALDAAIRAEVRRPFALSRAPLIRARLLRLAPDEHVLVTTWHHAIADEWSGGIFARELAAQYGGHVRGEPVALPALPIAYGDYARWQRESLRGPALARELAYWRETLAGAPAALELPTDRPRPPVQGPEGDVVGFRLDRVTVERTEALARELGATPFMVAFAAFAALLHRLSGEDDVVSGTPIAGRTRPETEDLIGFFANTIALRVRVDGRAGFAALVAAVREAASSAYAHQELPFDRVVEELAPRRDLSRHPIFQTLFSWHDEPASELRLDGLAVDRVDTHTGTAKFELSLFLHRDTGGAEAVLEYATALFDRATAERLASAYAALLADAVAEPSRPVARLALMSAADRRTVVEAWNATALPVPEGARVEALFAAQAGRTPGAVAVRHDGAARTYAEVAAAAHRLAHRLRRLGVRPGDRVAICLERGPELPAALLGVLASGAAYVPLDPSHPADRLGYVLADAAPRAVVCHARLAARFADAGVPVVAVDDAALADEPAGAPPRAGSARDTAYVLYTSGSTGRPKGVAVEHAAVVNLLAYTASVPGVGPGDRLLAVSTFAFDISVYELLAPLTVGACVVIATEEEVRDGAALLARMAAERVTILDATPATWRMLLESGWSGGDGLKAISTGEALAPELGAEIAARAGEAWNLYGPTEATVWAAFHRVGGLEQPMPIGAPVPNARLHVLDAGMQPVPPGVPGELHIGGAGLARGYLGRPALTAERFVPDPLGPPGARLYRTGDLVRRRPDGTIDYLGRLDHQVKLRGHRIELGEIEAALREDAGVAETAVVLEGEDDHARLAAYVAARGGTAPAADELRRRLAERLPAVMVPARFVTVDAMPLNANGKVDRSALTRLGAAAAEDAGPSGPSAPAPLGSVTERVVADVWAETLGIADVRPGDAFFEIGGHSVLALRAALELSRRLGREVPVVTLFQHPTVRALARALDATAAPPEAAPRRQVDRHEAAAALLRRRGRQLSESAEEEPR